MVIDGTNIGDNCVIGAGSIVTKNMPANKICFGVPCRVVKDKPIFYGEEELEK